MRYPVTFAKASGAGNDFVVIDNRRGEFPFEYSRFARAVCPRRTGIGADGLLILEKSDHADFTMKYFNADGSYGGMCGNGGRCIARFASLAGLPGPTLRFEALGFLYEAEISEPSVRLHMRDPKNYRPGIRVSAGGIDYTVSFVDTGAPHVVTFVSDLDSVDVQGAGSALRHSAAFAPDGVNVNFVHVIGPRDIDIRTYERGVEAETLACGTGSIAGSVVGAVERGLDLPVRVRVRSGEIITVDGARAEKAFQGITLEGSAIILYWGKMLYDSDSGIIQQSFPG